MRIINPHRIAGLQPKINIMRTLLFLFIIALAASCSNTSVKQSVTGRWISADTTSNPLYEWLIFEEENTWISSYGKIKTQGNYQVTGSSITLEHVLPNGTSDIVSWDIEVMGDTLWLSSGSQYDFVTELTFVRQSGDVPLLLLQEKSYDSSIRAIEIGPGGSLWFAGSKGTYGTFDGENWGSWSVKHESIIPEFRSLATTDTGVFILSVASPALLYNVYGDGHYRRLVYEEADSLVFYDSMEFWDNENGIAVGDIMNGCLSIIITRDGGNSWQKMNCSELPPALEGEGCFAASDTNIEIQGSHVWIATTKARVFHSADMGRTWEVQQTPIIQGGPMTGIFGIDFYDENLGFAVGGDWEDMGNNTGNMAITSDRGKTWELISEGSYPGYQSCVQFVPGSNGQKLLSVGIPGMSYSSDGGKSWNKISDESYYSVHFDPSGTTGWMSGGGKVARFELY